MILYCYRKDQDLTFLNKTGAPRLIIISLIETPITIIIQEVLVLYFLLKSDKILGHKELIQKKKYFHYRKNPTVIPASSSMHGDENYISLIGAYLHIFPKSLNHESFF